MLKHIDVVVEVDRRFEQRQSIVLAGYVQELVVRIHDFIYNLSFRFLGILTGYGVVVYHVGQVEHRAACNVGVVIDVFHQIHVDRLALHIVWSGKLSAVKLFHYLYARLAIFKVSVGVHRFELGAKLVEPLVAETAVVVLDVQLRFAFVHLLVVVVVAVTSYGNGKNHHNAQQQRNDFYCVFHCGNSFTIHTYFAEVSCNPIRFAIFPSLQRHTCRRNRNKRTKYRL